MDAENKKSMFCPEMFMVWMRSILKEIAHFGLKLVQGVSVV
jgi:hypothetical protein